MIFKFNNSLKKLVVGAALVVTPLTATATIHTITGEEGGGLGSNFTMLNATGITGGATNIDGTFDDNIICTNTNCNNFAMTLSSTQTFFGVLWNAHAVRVFGPGTYTIDTDCTEQDFIAGRYDCDPTGYRDIPGVGSVGFNGDPVVSDPTLGDGGTTADTQEGPDVTFTVLPGQLGAHMLFDWNGNTNIHVPVIWDLNQTFTVASDTAFPAVDQTLIYEGSNTSATCTGVGTGTGTAPFTQCDTTHTSSRIYKFASRDGNTAAIITRYVADTTKTVTTAVTEPEGIRGFAMVNGPFAGQNANFNLDMTPGYTPPVAKDDTSSAAENTLKVIDVLGNDSDVEDGAPPVGATVTLLTTTSAKGGTLVNNNDGTVDYTPVGLTAPDTDTFQYTINDTIGLVSNTVTVTITITAFVNTQPVANTVTFSTGEDVAKTININDSDDTATTIAMDVDGQALTFASVVSPTTQGGTVVIEAGSTDITYTPAQDFNGSDTFNFAVNDGVENSPLATMTINVSPANDAPTCTAVSLNTSPNTALAIDKATDLLANCTDVDGDSLTFDSATQPATAGSTIVDNGATLSYTPASDFEGDDTFTFDVSDGVSVVTAIATVKVAPPFSNFTMLDSTGNTFGGTNDVLFTWDETTYSVDASDTSSFGDPNAMQIISVKPQPFFSFFWAAHHIRVYGPGSYSFDSACAAAQYDAGTTDCGGTNPMTMTVGAGQIGAHILFDWGKPTTTTPCGVENCDIDVVNVWAPDAAWDRLGATGSQNALFLGAAGPAPDLATSWALVSTDVNGDGVNASPMVDGPFKDFYANFNAIAILPPGTVIGAAPASDVDPIPYDQQDTDLGDSVLASMNVFGLLAGLLVLLRLRQVGSRK